MITAPEGRWPPIYDADGLAKQIRDLIAADDFNAKFWDLRSFDHAYLCQGDIVALDSAVPIIDELGEPVATDDCGHWMAIGNTCDFVRRVEDVPWTQLVPLVAVPAAITEQHLGTFKRYEYSRRFYVPPWPGTTSHYFADFTRPVTVHKSAISGPAKIQARMLLPAWVLLHSCLIRFLARGDGRNDPT